MGHHGGSSCLWQGLWWDFFIFLLIIFEDVLHSGDGVRHVQIHALSSVIPSLFPFFPLVIVIKKICSLVNHFAARKWMYNRKPLGVLKTHLFVLLPLSYGQGRGWVDQGYSLIFQGSWVTAQRLQLDSSPASRCEQGLGNCSFPFLLCRAILAVFLGWCDPRGFSIPAMWDPWQVGAAQSLIPNFLAAGIPGALIL